MSGDEKTKTNDVDELVAAAQRQLNEHKEWLASRIADVPESELKIGQMLLLAQQARLIGLRVVKASTRVVTVVWEYPDELYAWLNSDLAPKQLRDSLAGGHVVDPNQPAWSARRVDVEG